MHHTLLDWKRLVCSIILPTLSLTTIAPSADWPMWRYDAGRSACSPDQLPARLSLLWSRRLPAPSPAWPASQHKLQFDTCYQPVAAGGRVFLPSNMTDSVTAYDANTGQELWRFYAEAPVRFAPAVHANTVLFASDDGYLYCVAADTGKLRWKFLAAPAERRGVGNNRLTSSWPARGGPVIHDGKVYTAASIWPFMGIFYHCLDAATGTVLWTNSGEGARWTVHPHGAPSFASVAPQGYLAISDDRMVVPGGRSTPGVFDANTGKYCFFKYDKKYGGGPVFAGNGHFFNSGNAYVLTNGETVHKVRAPILCEDEILTLDGSSLKSYRWDTTEKRLPLLERRGLKTKGKFFQDNWSSSASGMSRLFIRAGNRAYGSSGTEVIAIDLGANGSTSLSWSASVSAEPGAMIAANGKLVVAAIDGSLHCFGAGGGGGKTYAVQLRPLPPASEKWTAAASAMLTASETKVGFAVVLGVGSGELVSALIAASKLHVVVVEPDAQKADNFRRKLDAAGVYGLRATVVVGDPNAYPFVPYLATIIASEDSALVRSPSKLLLSALRPYGGAAWLPCSAATASAAAKSIEGMKVSSSSGMTVITREGALRGSGPWSHQYGDASNSAAGTDKLVRLPLGLLWFGGPPNDKILPRHGHGPSPQVAGGRLVIEGRHILRSVDAYTGMVIWERELKDIGLYHDHTGHQPGAGEIGSNYVTLPDAVYVAHNRSCLRLDAATGRTTTTFLAPKTTEGNAAHWGYLGSTGDYLVATFSPIAVASSKTTPPPRVGGPAVGQCDTCDQGERHVAIPCRRQASGPRLDVIWLRRLIMEEGADRVRIRRQR